MNKGESKIIGYTTMESMHIIWKRRWKRITVSYSEFLNMGMGMRTGPMKYGMEDMCYDFRDRWLFICTMRERFRMSMCVSTQS